MKWKEKPTSHLWPPQNDEQTLHSPSKEMLWCPENEAGKGKGKPYLQRKKAQEKLKEPFQHSTNICISRSIMIFS